MATSAAQNEAQMKLEEYIEKIHYSDRYSDDIPEDAGTLRLLTEQEWRGIGITQSLGWEHYEVHAPEPHVLLFRRRKDYIPPQHIAGKAVRRK
ncbi:Cyclin-dependent kinases regulatory subunit [Pleurotus pulmonarius]